MERKEIILRNLIQIAKRYESEHTGLLAWEIPSVRDAEKWLEELRKPDVIKSVCQCCGKRTIDYFNTKCKSCGTEHAYKQTIL